MSTNFAIIGGDLRIIKLAKMLAKDGNKVYTYGLEKAEELKNEENIIYINGLEIDQDKHICKLYDKQVELTPMEFDILLYLAQKRGNVVSSEELFEKVWKEKYLENNNTVMVHIRRIREKLNEDTKKPKFIKTVWGVGYKIEKQQ